MGHGVGIKFTSAIGGKRFLLAVYRGKYWIIPLCFCAGMDAGHWVEFRIGVEVQNFAGAVVGEEFAGFWTDG